MRVIIVGAGEVGHHTARWLSRENVDVVLIDHKEDKIRKLRETLDIQTVLGEGSDPDVLERAGAQGADMLVAVTNTDEVNMISCLLAGVQFGIPTKVARIRNPAYVKNPDLLGKKHLGINFTISPEVEVANKMVQLLEVPAASDLLEFADGKVQLIGLDVDGDSPAKNVKLRNLPVSVKEEQHLIVAILREDRILVPGGDDKILVGDRIFVMARAGEYSHLFRLLGKPLVKVRNVMIMGGGRIGLNIAKQLEKSDINVKIIEINGERCKLLTEELHQTVILHGDASDVSLLQEENISSADVFMAVSDDEEDNMLISLLAKRLGAKKVIAVVNRSEYIPIASSIGIDSAISPRISTAGAILRFIRKGKVLSVNTVREEEAEVMEVLALPTSAIVNKPIRKVKFPKGAIIAAVVRGEETIIPGGDDMILPDDKVVILYHTKHLKQVEKALAVKLEFF
jgi:trk system potassium uptake protein TrkA